MKEPYEEIEMEIIEFDSDDVIATSGGAGQGGDYDPWSKKMIVVVFEAKEISPQIIIERTMIWKRKLGYSFLYWFAYTFLHFVYMQMNRKYTLLAIFIIIRMMAMCLFPDILEKKRI